MSGGVDSSVAAYLMKAAGFDCAGVTMKLWDGAGQPAELPENARACCTLDDASDARSVAMRLEMPFYVFNFTEEFRRDVIGPFVDAYTRGQTPNPCIDCNRFLKFGRLLERAAQLGYDFVVTGHYARIDREETTGLYRLRKAVDAAKDQTYVLWSLTQAQLAHVRFPLGEMTKTEARAVAARQGFLNAQKPDSQDICFVPDGDHAGFIERTLGRPWPAGTYVDEAGNVLGTHRGVIRYTVGQHRGLGIALGRPAYVKSLDAANNRIVLSDNDALFARALTARDFNWIAGQPPQAPVRCAGKIRYRHREAACTAETLPDGRVRVTFDEPVRAVTPGQSVVLYDGDVVLGGGIICGEDA